MVVGTTLILIILGAIAAWILLEGGRISHKVIALILIGMIVFGYFSFTNVIQEKNIDVTTLEGGVKAAKIYVTGLVSWTGSAVKNIKLLTNKSVELDWSLNSSNSSEKTVENGV